MSVYTKETSETGGAQRLLQNIVSSTSLRFGISVRSVNA